MLPVLFRNLRSVKQQCDAAPPTVLQGDIETLSSDLSSTKAETSTFKVQTETAIGNLSQDLQDVGSKADQAQGLAQEVKQTSTSSINDLDEGVRALDEQLKTTKSLATTLKATTQTAFRDISETKDDLAEKTTEISKKAQTDLLMLKGQMLSLNDDLESELMAQIYRLRSDVINEQKGMSGNIHWYVVGGSALEVSKALLDAAAEGTFYRDVVLQLAWSETVGEETVYHPHTWYGAEPVITAHENILDEDVGVPTVKWTDDPTADPEAVRGELRARVIFDTGAGKTYDVDGTVDFDTQVSADDTILGYTVTKATVTFTVIA